MSASQHAETSPSGASEVARRGDTEEVDALPVLADDVTVVRAHPRSSELDRSRVPASTMLPAVQAAAVAAGGFAAGVAVVGLVSRRHRHSALARGRGAGKGLGRGRRGRRSTPSAGELVQIVGSRSLLVDVHLLGGRD